MKKIRVLQFSISQSACGQTQCILNLWKHIDHNRFQFDFITFSTELMFEEDLVKEGCRVFHITKYPEQDEAEFSRQFSRVLMNSYDVIHIGTSYWKKTIVEQLARKAGIPRIIIHSHSSGMEVENLYNQEALKKHYEIRDSISMKTATDFLACSEIASSWLFGKRIPMRARQIIYNGIDTDRFGFRPVKREEMRKELKVDDRFVIGFIGRLEKVKNVNFIIDLFPAIKKIMNNAFLLIVGHGSEKEMLEQKIKEQGLLDSCKFIGYSSTPEDYLQAMDLFLMPSIFEGLPLSLVEAQCSGVKCIVSKGISEEALITQNAERIDIADKETWLKRIGEIAREGYERRDQSNMVCAAGMDIKVQVKQMERLYQKSGEVTSLGVQMIEANHWVPERKLAVEA